MYPSSNKIDRWTLQLSAGRIVGVLEYFDASNSVIFPPNEYSITGPPPSGYDSWESFLESINTPCIDKCDLVAHLRFDGDLTDSVGDWGSQSVTGAGPQFTDDGNVESYDFDGDDFYRIDGDPPRLQGTNNVTILARVKFDTLSSDYIGLFSRTDTNGHYIAINDNTSNILDVRNQSGQSANAVYIDGELFNGGVITSIPIDPNKWYNVAWVYNSYFYDPDATYWFGTDREISGRLSLGSIDEFAILRKGLTQSQIREISDKSECGLTIPEVIFGGNCCSSNNSSQPSVERTWTRTTYTSTGSIGAGAISVGVFNSGIADAQLAGAVLPVGATDGVTAPSIDTIGVINFDATGTELIISELR